MHVKLQLNDQLMEMAFRVPNCTARSFGEDLEELAALDYLNAVPPAPDGCRFPVDRKPVEVRLD